MLVEDVIRQYPRIFHMAEADTWSSIRRHGLLSTEEVLLRSDLERSEIERLLCSQRPDKATVRVKQVGEVVLRDQKPMAESRLKKALAPGLTVQEWYRLINARVFFWAQEHRLLGLLNASAYRQLEHDVLIVDTASILSAHADEAWLCHMNSGNTFPVPHPRGRDAFKRIADYPAKSNGAPMKEVVEITFDKHVLDIAAHVLEVRRMRGSETIAKLYG